MPRPLRASLARRTLVLAACLSIAAPLARAADVVDDSFITTADGIRFKDSVRGTGPEPQPGQTVTVNYTGWLLVDGHKGRKFDSSFNHHGPFSFTVGAGQVIKGWDQGVSTMHVGGKRTLIVPPDLGYGPGGAGGTIPGGATLMFDIELLSVR